MESTASYVDGAADYPSAHFECKGVPLFVGLQELGSGPEARPSGTGVGGAVDFET
jgi:hypothetical protein